MADNVYLLETRLSVPQQTALEAVRSVAKQQGLTIFLVGGAVRDLISGSPVRDLDVVVQGNALKLRKELEKAGATYSGESAPQQALYMRFPSGVRMEVGSTLSVSFPKPGKPVYKPTTILDDLRRRDFTANAMALSLNEGSYGLLMDPLNGVADIENRELRLVSSYGFIEDPVRLSRAARFMARLGWQMDERTQARYQTAKQESYMAAIQPAERAYELEELFHEEEPLRVMRRLEDEGWLKELSPALGVAKANLAELTRLREAQMQLETRGVRADAAAANFPLLVAKVEPKEVEQLKKIFPRRGFVAEIDALESEAKDLGSQLLSKATALPSEAYKLIFRSHPATVLWAAHSSRSAALQARFKNFYNEWPLAFQKIPHLLLNEMRITADLPQYVELQEKLVFALMDGRLSTPEEMRAFLEPYSPPAPPPPISLRRPRAPRKEAKAPKSRKKQPEAAVGEDAPEETVIAATEAGGAMSETQPVVAQKGQKPQSSPSKVPAAAKADTSSKPDTSSNEEKKTKAVTEVPKAVALPAKASKLPDAVAASKGKAAPAKSLAKKTAPVKVTPKGAAKTPSKAVPAKSAKTTPAKKTPAKKTAAKSAKKAVPATSASRKPATKAAIVSKGTPAKVSKGTLIKKTSGKTAAAKRR